MADAVAGSAHTRHAASQAALEGAIAWLPLTLVLFVFAVLATSYNVKVPLFEAPDEVAHTRYVTSISQRGQLPRFEVVEDYESWQPPLYYVTGAAALKLLSLDPPPSLEWNPYFPAQANNYIHTSNEAFPYTESVLAVHILRAVSTLFSMGTIVIIYLAAGLIFPARRVLAFAAAITAALIPQFAFISGTVSNDAAAVFFASATTYFGLRFLREERKAWLIAAALTLSLGALTKLSAITAGAVPVGVILLGSWGWMTKTKYLAVLTLAPIVLAGWFYVRSLIIWGALFPADHFWPLNPTPIWDPAYRQNFLEPLRDSFWYTGGALTVRLSPILHDILNVVSVLAVAGVIVLVRQRKLPEFQHRGLRLLLALPVLAFVTVLYYSVSYDYQPQGRYLFVAMLAFAILLPLGLSTLFSQGDEDSLVVLAFPAFLLTLNLYIVTTLLPRAY